MNKITYVAVCLCTVLPQQLYAELITIQASGYLQSVEGGLNNEFSVGEIFTYTYTYDSNAIDTNVDFRRGSYLNAIQTGALIINDFSLSFTGGRITVDNDYYTGVDTYQPVISGPSGHTLTGPSISGKIPGAIDFDLADMDGTVFSNDDLPGTAPDLSQFENKLITLYYADEVHSYGLVGVDRAYGKVTSIVAIPEPEVLGMMTLFGGGLLAIRRCFPTV